jgi:predicted DNA-binding protein
LAQVKKNVASRLDIEDYIKLKKIAEHEGRTISNKIKMIIESYLKSKYKPRRKKRSN